MTRILTITLSALMLAGCADSYDKSADINDCKRAAAADHLDNQPNYSDTNTIGHNFADIPARILSGGGREHAPHGTSASKCVHNEDNKANAPQINDLQKLGAARSFGIKSRPV